MDHRAHPFPSHAPRIFLFAACAIVWGFLSAPVALSGAEAPDPLAAGLDPRGRVHIPIGIPDDLDSLKTFVEAEGNFSPGFGSYGIYFWLWDEAARRLHAPTLAGTEVEHGLAPGGILIPWSRWKAGDVGVRSEVCQVLRATPVGPMRLVGARVHLRNDGPVEARLSLFVALRPLGAAGFAVRSLRVSAERDALLVDGHPAIVAELPAPAAGVSPRDDVAVEALAGRLPAQLDVESPSGEASGAMLFSLALAPGETRCLRFLAPVLPGRRAVGHRWDGTSPWAQFDLAVPNPPEGGLLQPALSLDAFRAIARGGVDALFADAVQFWERISRRVRLRLPDPRWQESFAAITAHSALCMNEGAPDVAVVNFNVFNRDGIYVASIFQKTGNTKLAERAIDYFLAHPFNGRVEPEADNPGQILWILGEHWKFTRNRAWLERVGPAVAALASMVRYYRTEPEPHWVAVDEIGFGEGLPPERRRRLVPGACDGQNPAYTEAYDVAGLRAAAELAEALGRGDDAAAWGALATQFLRRYEDRFGGDLAKGYGSYAVLWPCRLFPLGSGPAHERFRGFGGRDPESWRYFPLAAAHQGLLAGNRDAGWRTIESHLAHPTMRGWYAFDEGGESGAGGWNHVRTRWRQGPASVAMPHGWAIAEFLLLLRDSLAFEDGDRLVLFAGVPPEWFEDPQGMAAESFPTHHGDLAFEWTPESGGARLALGGAARPPGGFVLRLPIGSRVEAAGRVLTASETGEVALSPEVAGTSLRVIFDASRRR